MFERMCAAELLQGPVVLTFSVACDGLDLGFENCRICCRACACVQCACVSGYLNLFFVKNHEEGVKSTATKEQMHTSSPQPHVTPHVGALWLPEVGMVKCARALKHLRL